jgi:hypothetical protein
MLGPCSHRFLLRRDRHGAAETLQSLASVTIVIVCAGLVLSAVAAATSAATQRAERPRAAEQGEIVLDALARDPTVAAHDGAVAWTSAEAIAAGRANLSFLPEGVRVVTLRPAAEGGELFLAGSTAALSPELVFVAHPVPIMMPDGSTVAGVAKAGVAPA